MLPAQEPKEPVEAKPIKKPNGTLVSYTEEYSGLIPHPRLMREWNDIVPGSAEKIFNRFEKQSDHRMQMENHVVKANNFKQYTGPIFGFIIAMTTILGGIYTALKGLTFLGGGLSFSGLAVLVGAFLVNTYQKPKETRIKKTESN
jgi:uncharacterized membrane protein